MLHGHRNLLVARLQRLLLLRLGKNAEDAKIRLTLANKELKTRLEKSMLEASMVVTAIKKDTAAFITEAEALEAADDPNNDQQDTLRDQQPGLKKQSPLRSMTGRRTKCNLCSENSVSLSQVTLNAIRLTTNQISPSLQFSIYKRQLYLFSVEKIKKFFLKSIHEKK